jgi:transposase-like protein
MSTTTDPILDAAAAIDAQEPEEQPSYRAAADAFGVNKDTLRRRHKGQTRSYAGDAKQRMLLSPQQEIQLVQYIETLSARSILPTRTIIANYASALAKWEVSDS